MTDIVRAEVDHTLRGDPTTELVAWARAAEAAAELARPLSQTSFVPEVYQGKAGDAAAAILVGAEVGLSPMQALQGIYVIKGKPAMYARTLMAIVLAAGHEVWTEKASADRVIVKGRRRGSERVETSEWTIGRAKTAGYTSNKKYDTDPEAMLLARAQAELCRRLAPDAILGMAYAVEELQDDEPAPTGKRTVSRKSKPAPDPASAWGDDVSVAKYGSEPRQLEPGQDGTLRQVADVDLPPLPGDEAVVLQAEEEKHVEWAERQSAGFVEPEPPTPAMDRRPGSITQPQMRMMMALLKQAGLDERDDRLDYCRTVIGRDVESSTDLTKGEAQQILDRLVELTKGDAEPGFDDELHPDEVTEHLPYKDD